jgi:hypothetical protein
MAFNTSTEWDVRTTGSDANGGGFNTAATGTDRSQQDAAFIAFTDLVIDATTNTKITSAGNPFGSTSPGNVINITGGTGFTVQRVQVVSVSGTTATCDKAVGTTSSTGGTGNLGGSLLTIGQAATLAGSGNAVHVKSGTYTVTTGATLTAGSIQNALIGYGTTHNDGGTAPLMTTATNSITLLTLAGGFAAGLSDWVSNINFSSSAGTPGIGIAAGSGGPGITISGCKISGCSKGIDANTSGNFANFLLSNCEISGCTTWGALLGGSGSTSVIDCYIHGNGGAGTGITTGGLSVSTLKIERSLVTANAGVNILLATGSTPVHFIARSCTFALATGTGGSTVGGGSGICLNQGSTIPTVTIENCLFYGNAGWGVFTTNASVILWQIARANAYGGNTQGGRGKDSTGTIIPAGTGDVTLSANPFTNSGSGDFSLNTTAGGGAACKAAGYPGVFPGATSTGAPDIGAVQGSAAGAAGGLLVNPGMSGGMRG